MQRKTSIIVLSYNNLELLKNCIESIRKYTKKEDYELIVVDNNSNEEVKEYLKKQDDIILKLNDENYGYPKGCNIGITLASKDNDILLLNNDTIVTTNWLENLRKCLYSRDDIGVVGPVCGKIDNLQYLELKYKDFEEMQEKAKENNISDPNRWEEKVFLIGYCILMKREVFDKVGYLDENYTPGYIEDNDYSLRILKAGYKLYLCHDCYIYHHLGVEFRKDLSKLRQILDKNRAYFYLKWGFSAFEFDEVKRYCLEILKKIDNSKNYNILDLYCGIGASSLKIKNILKKSNVIGFEEDVMKANISKCVINTITGNINDIESSVKEKFDIIVIGNILEKIENYDELLKKLKLLLKDDGIIVGNFYNANYYKNVYELLRNRWVYATRIAYDAYNKNNFTKDDMYSILSRNEYKEIEFLHWYNSNIDDEENIIKLGRIVGEERIYLYKTYAYSFIAKK